MFSNKVNKSERCQNVDFYTFKIAQRRQLLTYILDIDIKTEFDYLQDNQNFFLKPTMQQ